MLNPIRITSFLEETMKDLAVIFGIFVRWDYGIIFTGIWNRIRYVFISIKGSDHSQKMGYEL